MPRLTLALVATLLTVLAAPAGATTSETDSLAVRIEHVDAAPDGTTVLTLSVSGLPPGEDPDLASLQITENGEPVEDLRLAASEELGGEETIPGVVLAMDTSGSTEGEPIAAAKSAAIQLFQSLAERGAQVGLVAFGETTETLSGLQDPASIAVAEAGEITASGGTALYDGVARAARMLSQHEGPRDVVVFSDGEDTTSRSTLDDVRGLLDETGVRVTSVVLRSDGVVIPPLEALAAVNDGRLIEVDEATGLAEAFAGLVGDLTNRLRIEWVVDPDDAPSRVLNIVATYEHDDVVASDGAQLDSPRLVAVTPPRPVEGPEPLVPGLAGRTGLLLASGATGVAMLLLMFLILAGAGERRRQERIDERLAAYQAAGDRAAREDRVTISDRASRAFDAIPRPENLDSRIAATIEQADWPLRVSEFLLLTMGAAAFGLLAATALTGSLIVGAVGFLLGLAGPWVYLQRAVAKRRAAFAEQLPTVLQVLSGALRAGHAFSTALDRAVDEVDEPAKAELRRASVEARLGRPLDRALAGVAERMDSVDLQWVIGALEVQREVGGNLAEILNNVAATLRDRASIGRHVKALTAEGRLSAVVIAAMPFVMFLFMTVTNPTYIAPLFQEPLGRLMLGMGAVLLVAGIFVLRRLVQPKY